MKVLLSEDGFSWLIVSEKEEEGGEKREGIAFDKQFNCLIYVRF